MGASSGNSTGFGLRTRSGNALQDGALNVQSMPAKMVVGVDRIEDAPLTVQDVATPRVSVPTITNPGRNFVNTPYTTDSLDISETSVTNEKISPIRGFSSQRPEILALFDLLSVFLDNKGNLSDAGKLLDYKYQALKLRDETVEAIIKNCSEQPELKKLLVSLTTENNDSIEKTRNILDFFNQNIKKLNEIKQVLEIKYIPDTSFDLTKFLSLRTFYNAKMQYNTDSFESFTNTKILLQLLFDMRSIFENYSFSLLNLIDTDRTNDTSAINLDNTYTLQGNFSFTIAANRSTRVARNAAQEREFSSFVSSLPNQPEDKIKLLTVLLSKELRVSKALAQKDVQRKLVNFYGGSEEGNPFDNIVGNFGTSIFDTIPSKNSLNSLGSIYSVSNEESVVVLPLEERQLEFDNKLYIPGKQYFFTDTLKTGDITKFNNYSNYFTNTVSEAKSIVSNLFDLTNSNSLNISSLFYYFISAINSSIKDLSKPERVFQQIMSMAIWKLATTDRKLKLMLFQYLILCGIATNDKEDQKKLFENVAHSDLQGSIENLSFVKANLRSSGFSLDGGTTELAPAILQLAEDIENYIYDVIYQEKTNKDSFEELGTTILERSRFQLFARGSVKEALWYILTPGQTTIFKEFLTLVHKLEKKASGMFLADSSGRTKYNFISSSYLCLFVFEIISNLIAKFGYVDFAKSDETTYFALKFDSEKNSYVSRIFGTFIQEQETATVVVPTDASVAVFPESPGTNKNDAVKKTPLENQTEYELKENYGEVIKSLVISGKTAIARELLDIQTSFTDIKEKILYEDAIVGNLINFLEVFARRFTDASRNLSRYYTNMQPEKKTLLQMFGDTFESQIQINLSSQIFDFYTKDKNYLYPAKKTVTTNEYNLILNVLNNPSYIDSQRNRVMVVGVPNGFSKWLFSRTTNKNLVGTKQEADLINLVVYKRDMIYDDIVFKPLRFIFDLSLFASKPEQEVDYTKNFDFVTVPKLSIVDFSDGSKQTYTLNSLKTNKRYSALSSTQTEELFRNHVVSDVLKNYAYILMDIFLTEEIFVGNTKEKPGVSDKQSTFLRAYYLSQKNIDLGSQDINDILFKNTLSLTRQELDDLWLLGGYQSRMNTTEQMALDLKQFERVFLIPVNTDSFVIDERETMKTASGRRAMSVLQTEEVLLGTETYKKPKRESKDPSAYIFENYFVTIETQE